MKQIIKKVKRHHIREVIVYAMVGGNAWVAQTISYLALIRLHWFPSIAMICGNFAGLLVSYYGHTQFTFRKHRFSHKEFVKFVVTSIIGLCINIGGVRLITKVLLLNPEYAIIPTLFTPAITFLISKFWAFK
ncbi:MAG: GtrA family protein [Burkholderiales bacterium]